MNIRYSHVLGRKVHKRTKAPGNDLWVGARRMPLLAPRTGVGNREGVVGLLVPGDPMCFALFCALLGDTVEPLNAMGPT